MSEKPVDLDGDLPPTGAYDTPETVVVQTTRVSCDGGGPGLGHPRVWLQIPLDRGWVECGYCDKRFVLDENADVH
ncbi:zinc-finger domain-containing protein [Oceaniglobus indicus]|uniref:zinc-finger domain-containing protein n=1 Tax=Oceaniglobus indicus TaxID=2047749 RepID=UPI000C17B30D|nr:zinc-finger domain-containing protein [Oceaniglobus indicus]